MNILSKAPKTTSTPTFRPSGKLNRAIISSGITSKLNRVLCYGNLNYQRIEILNKKNLFSRNIFNCTQKDFCAEVNCPNENLILSNDDNTTPLVFSPNTTSLILNQIFSTNFLDESTVCIRDDSLQNLATKFAKLCVTNEKIIPNLSTRLNHQKDLTISIEKIFKLHPEYCPQAHKILRLLYDRISNSQSPITQGWMHDNIIDINNTFLKPKPIAHLTQLFLYQCRQNSTINRKLFAGDLANLTDLILAIFTEELKSSKIVQDPIKFNAFLDHLYFEISYSTDPINSAWLQKKINNKILPELTKPTLPSSETAKDALFHSYTYEALYAIIRYTVNSTLEWTFKLGIIDTALQSVLPTGLAFPLFKCGFKTFQQSVCTALSIVLVSGITKYMLPFITAILTYQDEGQAPGLRNVPWTLESVKKIYHHACYHAAKEWFLAVNSQKDWHPLVNAAYIGSLMIAFYHVVLEGWGDRYSAVPYSILYNLKGMLNSGKTFSTFLSRMPIFIIAAFLKGSLKDLLKTHIPTEYAFFSIYDLSRGFISGIFEKIIVSLILGSDK